MANSPRFSPLAPPLEKSKKCDIFSKSDLIFDRKIARECNTSLEAIKWLTTGEAAQYLRVSISSLKTMIYRGQVRVHKLGRRNRFLREDLERLIKSPN
jgi:excisionase family DNA binding protein